MSRVHVKKGINFLVEAVAQLKELLQGYVVRIAGEGDATYMEDLKQLAVYLGVSNLIRFEGGVYGNRKWKLFQQTDYLYYLRIARILVLWWRRLWLVELLW